MPSVYNLYLTAACQIWPLSLSFNLSYVNSLQLDIQWTSLIIFTRRESQVEIIDVGDMVVKFTNYKFDM